MTGLGAGVINPAAIRGILGANQADFMERIGLLLAPNPPETLSDPDSMEYFTLSPELLADQIVYAINQPWGISIRDLTVRASDAGYLIQGEGSRSHRAR